MTDFLFLGSKNRCEWWLQPWNQKTASWQESDDKPRQHAEKQRHYSADKGPCSQGYGLPSGHVRLWELDPKEGRVPKNWCLRTVVLEKTPTVHWRLSNSQARRSNQSILKEINPEYSLEGLMLKLKLQYFGHLMWIAKSFEKTWMLRKLEVRRVCQSMRRLGGITNTMDMNLGKLREMVREKEAWHAPVHGVTKSQTQLGDWTTATIYLKYLWQSLDVE